MCCVPSPAKPAASCIFALLLGAVIVVGISAPAAHARDVDAAPLHSWCIARRDLPPDCVYHDLFTCGITAILTGSTCVKAEPSLIPATTVAAAPVRQKRKVARHKSSADQHDKLFQEFVRWKRDPTN